MSMEIYAVALRKVSFRYGPSDPWALDEVCAEIPAKSITALLGPNGSGKSTLLHLVLGLLNPSKGAIQLLGRNQYEYTRREASRILGLVPQDEHVAFDLSVLEYVLLGRAPYLNLLEKPRRDDRLIARKALVTAGIASLEERSVPSLSGGERQLATIARALAQQPVILLLDEPTSHLDLANARRALNVLRSLKQSGKTVVLTTHDPNAAASIADHVILLRSGKVLCSGPAADALTSEHLSSTYGVEVEVLQVRGRPWVLTHMLFREADHAESS
jgi:iron complex transport system ATP-binding protein